MTQRPDRNTSTSRRPLARVARAWQDVSGAVSQRDKVGTRGDVSTPVAPTSDIRDVEAFLYREARLLDERRWVEWLGLWSDDATTSMPTRRSVLPDGRDVRVEDELVADGGVWWFDESRYELELRVAKLMTGKAWAEQPPSRTRRFVSNVEVAPADRGDELEVRSNVMLHRGRRDHEAEWFSYARADRLVVDPEGLKISSRRVVLDANVVAADNLIVFF